MTEKDPYLEGIMARRAKVLEEIDAEKPIHPVEALRHAAEQMVVVNPHLTGVDHRSFDQAREALDRDNEALAAAMFIILDPETSADRLAILGQIHKRYCVECGELVPCPRHDRG